MPTWVDQRLDLEVATDFKLPTVDKTATTPMLPASLRPTPRTWTVLRRLSLILLIGSSAYIGMMTLGAGEILADLGALRDALRATGSFGPLAVMSLMTVAVVLSPLPSAPVALASGALYGHTWGTVYVLVGAEIGALIAFAIARYLRPAALAGWLEGRLSFGRFDSQDTLMLAVCVSRLVPFVSFDLASYAAGLTPLRLWRFALATLIGILPASFTLAHFGGELGSFDAGRVALSLAVLALLGALPWIWAAARKWVGDRKPQ